MLRAGHGHGWSWVDWGGLHRGGPAAQAMWCPRAGQHRMSHPAPPVLHRAVLTQHQEHEMIIPNDQILIMQHRG